MKLDNIKILLVANVAKEHILKFHVPTLRYMEKLGWQVDVACSGDEDIPHCRKQYHTSWRRSPFSFSTIKGIRELKTIIANGNYDVVYCHTPVGGAVARIAAREFRRNGLKVVYMAHGFHFYKGAPIVNWLIYFPIEKIMSKWTDCIITINNEDFLNARKLLNCKKVIKIDGIGIDLSRFSSENISNIRKQYRKELNIPIDASVMIYLAELIPNKNQKLLFDTLRVLRKHGKNFYLLLAGVDHNDGKDMKYAKKIGVYKYVRYLGWRSDIENLYKASDICTASSIREGFGINIVEAMASGLPVVATNNRGHSTIIKDGESGFLVDYSNPRLMAKQILVALKSKQRLIEKYQLEKYESDSIVKRITENIKMVIREGECK